MTLVLNRPHRYVALTADHVARRNELAELLEQAAVEACLFGCANEGERRFVMGRAAGQGREARAP
jgi:hypothetical protein